ncbi:MAG: helix-turn-helix domain-containing protein [Candidatus Binatia bacterium]
MKQTLKSTLARNLRSFRLRAGLSQSDLARKAGTLQPRVAVMESVEDSTLPRLEWLARVADALGLSVAELLSEKAAPEPGSLSSLPENGDNLAAHLKGFGAPFTGTSRKSRSFSPEAVVLGVLRVVPSSRMVECLPGLLFKRDMDHKKLLRLARKRGLVNRLGFVVDVAAALAKESGDLKRASRLDSLSTKLWSEKDKVAEEFLMSEVPEEPEFRNWVKKKTPRLGKKWGVYGAYSLERFREGVKRAA